MESMHWKAEGKAVKGGRKAAPCAEQAQVGHHGVQEQLRTKSNDTGMKMPWIYYSMC